MIWRVLPPTFKPVINLIYCKTGLMWMVKRATSIFNCFVAMLHVFGCLFYRTLRKVCFLFFFRSSYYFCDGVFGNCVPALWPTQHVIILILYKIAGLLLEWRVLLFISTKNSKNYGRRRKRWQREHQKRNGFILAKKTLHMHNAFFCSFLSRRCTTTT